MYKFILRALTGLVLVAGVAACGEKGGSVKPDTTNVEDRAVKRWELLIAGNATEAYDYLTPGFRQTNEKGAYVAAMSHRPVKWKTIKYMDKECEGDVCNLRLFITFSVNLSAGIGRPVESSDVLKEKWIKVKGVWYHLPGA